MTPAIRIAGFLRGVEVRFREGTAFAFLPTRHVALWGASRPVASFHSRQVANLLMHDFAAWHDERLNCATWTDAAGCRCEVDT